MLMHEARERLLMQTRAPARPPLLALLLALLLLASTVAGQSDADGDGVDDADDECPDTAEGSEVDENGCSETQRNVGDADYGSTDDTDDDGVIDSKDICPDTETGSEVDDDGCATYQLDGDGDGVLDDDDECPDTLKSERREVNENGCTPFMSETLVEQAPVVGRISNGQAVSAGTVSLALGALGWVLRAGRVVGLTGGASGKRRKKRLLRRINNTSHTRQLDDIGEELNIANEKSKLPDGAYADLMVASVQRRIELNEAAMAGDVSEPKFRRLPSRKPPGL
ncbi:MAG: hypothetical protein MK233_03325 [Candidatus Poseidoniales archaeon]|nr:hypothetical protein [Candidatus Poseidoniales archaeon]